MQAQTTDELIKYMNEVNRPVLVISKPDYDAEPEFLSVESFDAEEEAFQVLNPATGEWGEWYVNDKYLYDIIV